MEGKRVLVCGGRDYHDRRHVWNTLFDLDRERGPFAVIIHGACRTGADEAARRWATEAASRQEEPYEAEWSVYGPPAGPIRNKRMIDEAKPELVIAFKGDKGTADCVRRAESAGIEIITVRPRN